MAKTLIDAIESIGLPAQTVINLGVQQKLAVYQNAVSHPIGSPAEEEVAVCYTVGTLVFTEFKEGKKTDRYGLLDMDLFNLDGVWNGRYLTIWQPQIKTGDDLGAVPVPEYTGPFDKVVKPIPPAHLRADSNASYEFRGNGGTGTGTMFATGPANLLLTKLASGGAIFQVSVAAYITGGTGDFEGARGTNTALGSSYVPPGVDINSVPLGMPIGGVTVSTFRFVRKKNQG
jgi:hypothetical protein